MRIYLKRIQKQIWPFILIGLLIKIVFQFQGILFSSRWLKVYLNYADISLHLKLQSFQRFGEFIAPVTIAYVLVFLYLLAFFHHLLMGRKGEGNSFFVSMVLLPLEELASLLSIATLGLLIGISIGSIPSGIKTVITFLVLALHPIFFLLFLAIGVGFVVVQNKTVCTGWMESHLPGFIRSRVDGLYLFLLFFLAITFHTKIHAQIIHTGKWFLRLL